MEPLSKQSEDGLSSCFFHIIDWGRDQIHKQRALFRNQLSAGAKASKQRWVVAERVVLESHELSSEEELVILDPNVSTDDGKNYDGFLNYNHVKAPEAPEMKMIQGRKRTSNVIAQLMGLEDSPKKCIYSDREPNSIKQSEPKQQHLHSMASLCQSLFDSNEEEEFSVNNKFLRAAKKDVDNSSRILYPCGDEKKNPSFPSVLSPSKAQNMMVAPIRKCPLSTKATICFLEAANEVLEPNMQCRKGHITMKPKDPQRSSSNSTLSKAKNNDKVIGTSGNINPMKSVNDEEKFLRSGNLTESKAINDKKRTLRNSNLPHRKVMNKCMNDEKCPPRATDTLGKCVQNEVHKATNAPSPSKFGNKRHSFEHNKCLGTKPSAPPRSKQLPRLESFGNPSGPNLVRYISTLENNVGVSRREKTAKNGCEALAKGINEDRKKADIGRNLYQYPSLKPRKVKVEEKYPDSSGKAITNSQRHSQGCLYFSTDSKLSISQYNRKRCVSGITNNLRTRKSKELMNFKTEIGCSKINMSSGVQPSLVSKGTAHRKKLAKAEEILTLKQECKHLEGSNKVGDSQRFFEFKKHSREICTRNLIISNQKSVKNENAEFRDKSCTKLRHDRTVISSTKVSRNHRSCYEEKEMMSTRHENLEMSVKPEVPMYQRACDTDDVVDISYEFSDEVWSDSASSDDICTQEKEAPLSCSGESASVILHELLMSLNPSGRCFTLKKKLNKNELFNRTPSLDVWNTKINGKDINKSMDYIGGIASGVDSDSLNNRFKGMEELSTTTERYSFEECSGESCLASPSSNLDGKVCNDDASMCLGSFRFTDDIRDNKFGSMRCMTIISRESYGNNVFNETAKVIISSDEDYVNCILNNVALSPMDIYSATMHLSEGPQIDPSLFNALEELVEQDWEWKPKALFLDKDVCHSQVEKITRKMMFDCVVEALSVFPQKPFASVGRNVMRIIEGWRCMHFQTSVHEMISKSISTGMGKWDNFSYEVCAIVIEVADNIFEGLLQELMFDLRN